MSNEKLLKALRNASAAAERGEPGAAEDARALANMLKANGGVAPKASVMSHLNTGIANAAGGVVDFFNPFDKPHALNPLPQGTGSAVTGLRNTMDAVGIDTTDEQPQNVVQAFARGTGEAAGTLFPAAKATQMLAKGGGLLGSMADDVFTALATKGGVVADVAAGGTSRAAETMARDAGAPEWVQDTAAMLAPMGVGAAAIAGGKAAQFSPVRAAANKALEVVAPYTRSGAEKVASERVKALAGGSSRAQDLADEIAVDNPLNLTPAQQTQDPNLLALERSAADLDPNLRVELEARKAASEGIAKQGVEAIGGDTQDAQAFFLRNRRDFKAKLEQSAQDAQEEALAKVRAVGGKRTESENSVIVSDAVRRNLDLQLAEEKRLWGEVPRGAQVGTATSKAVAQDLVDDIPYAQRKDIPQPVRDLLEQSEVYGDNATVKEMYGLYSELRRVARSAMAGNDQNKNMARIANEVADSILDDLGAKSGLTDIGKRINEARAFSAALHETFDRGAPGRILKRTLDGDTAIDPEVSLKRTVDRAGAEGMVTARQLEEAGGAPVQGAIEDHLRSRFAAAAVKPGTDDVNLTGGRAWLGRNQELLSRFPEVKSQASEAIDSQLSADALASSVQNRVSNLGNPSKSAVAAFSGSQPEKAINAITQAKDPVSAARRIAAEARRDTSGQALAGVKGSFADYLVAEALKSSGNQGFSASALSRVISDPKFSKAMAVVFTPDEMKNIRTLAGELKKAQYGSVEMLGDNLSGASANSIISVAARIAGANYGASLGGSGGASIQTANIMSNRVRGLLDRLASDRASQMLSDAVTDPELMKALLEGTNPKVEKLVVRKILPYVVGGASSTLSQDEPTQGLLGAMAQ